MDIYQEIQQLVERYKVEFPEYGYCGIRKSLIEQAEKSLGLPLPISYKWWLENYGGGQIRSDLLYGLDDDGIGKPDIIDLAQSNKNDGLSTDNQLVFAISNDEEYFFDTSVLDANGEYAIYERNYSNSEPELYANSFAEFLKRRIAELCY